MPVVQACLCLFLLSACSGNNSGLPAVGVDGGPQDRSRSSLPFWLPDDGEVQTGGYVELMAWLLAGNYRDWESESEVRPSTQGPKGVRIFLNSSLAGSLFDAEEEHPVGSTAVRELYEEDLETLSGFALAIKTGNGSRDRAGNWFWFETFGLQEDMEPIIVGHAAPGCMPCHSQGVDFIRSFYPLR